MGIWQHICCCSLCRCDVLWTVLLVTHGW